MTFFVLTREDAPPDTLGAFALAAGQQHFRHTQRLGLGAWRLDLFASQSADEVPFHAGADGDFAIALGSMLYDGRAAPDCLPALLRDFQPETFRWAGLAGMHVGLVRRDGRLHVFGDGLGACQLYRNADGTVWSSSFLAMLELVRPRTLDAQACYEYVCNGAVFGTRTLVEDVTTLPANVMLVVDETVECRRLPSPIDQTEWSAEATLDDIADAHVRQLDAVFEPIARNFGDRLRVSFSGGFDSRLMLAMLQRHGVKPTLFVYGAAGEDDVEVARLIARAEGLALQQVDKRLAAAVDDPDAFADALPRDLFAFDGWKVDSGLFDFGVDREDRLSRHVDGRVPLNGSLGEIYRNFFYMPDRPASTGAVISTFYSRYDPRAFTERFDEGAYRDALAASMRAALGVDTDALDRAQVEELYPKFRGRFWTGRDAQINQRFGTMFFPYLEHAAIANTAKIPLRYKDLGKLQGRMIARVDARLAAHPSDYGFALDGPRPLAYRVKSWLGTQRPPALRKRSFRLTHRRPEPLPSALSPEFLERVLDLEFPVLRTLFRLDGIRSAQQYGLVATLEYLAQRYDLIVGSA